MKPASQLMATMGNLPAVEPRQPLQVTPQTAEVVNDLFRRLRGIFPAWRQAWPSTEALDAAKAEWIKEFADEGIRTLEQIEFGIQKCRKLKKPFAPSVGEFIAMCVPGPEDFGMPSVAGAWMEALMETYSHEGVRIAAIATGLFDLRSAKQEDKGLRQRFDHNYEIILRRAQAGQALDGRIATGIGHDSQKTAFELANELADQKAQAKIIEQGIPADGKSARALLLAKMNIKRDAQRGAEKF
ncbi:MULTISPECIES: replication protein P [unclassified Pseudomonas]|uniref:replication protein P n=1 Tax=unclassified Pseudomonas TaxID=196821 RepID=UPI000C8786D1|nr:MULTISPECIES: replication protein P [unclassified Pseudomonas]PMU87094.1 Replication protein P [Pseudomonas sp. GW704-F3]PMU91424.1 Replication protein P [Pseudomonas sp. GW704-F5]PMV01224.1 Replication protein P [Pseudomonas sp. MPBD4-3]PMV25768.1 Replication protein P [Pseudomonas sp. GW704-F2]